MLTAYSALNLSALQRLKAPHLRATTATATATTAAVTDSTDAPTIVATRRNTATLTDHTDAVANSLAFSPDGKTLASGGDDGTVRLWKIPP